MQQHKENMAPNSVSKRQSEAMTTPARAVSSGLQRKLDAMKAAQEASESSRRAAVRQTDHLHLTTRGSVRELAQLHADAIRELGDDEIAARLARANASERAELVRSWLAARSAGEAAPGAERSADGDEQQQLASFLSSLGVDSGASEWRAAIADARHAPPPPASPRPDEPGERDRGAASSAAPPAATPADTPRRDAPTTPKPESSCTCTPGWATRVRNLDTGEILEVDGVLAEVLAERLVASCPPPSPSPAAKRVPSESARPSSFAPLRRLFSRA